MDKEKYNVYIDESGDLGINKGTRWFAITGVIVKEENEKEIRNKLKSIKKHLNMDQIHIRKIRSFEERALIVNDLNSLPFTFITIFVDTNKLSSKLTSLQTYNYSCRLLLERISWCLKDVNGIGNVVLSSRGTSRDQELLDYIDKIVNYRGNQIKSDYISTVTAKTSGSWDLLQLADVCATSCFLSREINRYGFRIPCFLSKMYKHVYSHDGVIKNYGIKYYSSEMEPEIKELKLNLICK